MSEYISLLITIYYQASQSLIKCALKVKISDLPSSIEYIMEDNSRKALHAMLPLHVRECGPIVEVEEIFEVHSLEAA